MITMVLGISILAQAQTKERQHKSPQQRAERIGKMLQTKLNLSADQSTKVNAILLTRATQMETLKANKGTDKKANREAFKNLLVKTDSELSKVFTADQLKTYGELKSKFKGGHRGGKGLIAGNHKRFSKNPGERAERMAGMLKKKLNLSDDQSVKVKSILLSRATQMDSLRSNKVAGDKKINGKNRKLIMHKTDEDLKAVFNAEQQQTYSQLKAQLKDRHKAGRDTLAPSKGK